MLVQFLPAVSASPQIADSRLANPVCWQDIVHIILDDCPGLCIASATAAARRPPSPAMTCCRTGCSAASAPVG